MTHTWNNIEGASLPGDYSLPQFLSSNGHGAFFRSTIGAEATPALVKLVPEQAVDAEAQLALWRRTRHLSHPHLMALIDFGRAQINGGKYLYAVFEYPEDRLE